MFEFKCDQAANFDEFHHSVCVCNYINYFSGCQLFENVLLKCSVIIMIEMPQKHARSNHTLEKPIFKICWEHVPTPPSVMHTWL